MVRLERMRWWHVEQLLPVERALFGEEPWTARTFWSELGQLDTRHYLVALSHADGRAEELVGYAGLCDYPDEAWVQTMAVAPAAQGQGLGRRLLRALLEEAERRGQRTVRLEVRADNPVAQGLYAGHGFVQEGVRRGYYQPSGADAVLMVRRARSPRAGDSADRPQHPSLCAPADDSRPAPDAAGVSRIPGRRPGSGP